MEGKAARRKSLSGGKREVNIPRKGWLLLGLLNRSEQMEEKRMNCKRNRPQTYKTSFPNTRKSTMHVIIAANGIKTRIAKKSGDAEESLRGAKMKYKKIEKSDMKLSTVVWA